MNKLRDLRLATADEHLSGDAPPLGAQFSPKTSRLGTSKKEPPLKPDEAAAPRDCPRCACS